jgi:hypothetical protein
MHQKNMLLKKKNQYGSNIHTKMYKRAVYQWLTHVILGTQEAEIRGLQFTDSPGK